VKPVTGPGTGVRIGLLGGLLAGLAALIACALLTSTPALLVSAHAVLVRSLPAANAELAQSPTQIDLWLSEPLEAGFSQARLLASDGREVSAGAVIIDPADPLHMTLPVRPIPPGIYTVSWRTLSKADGHAYSGSFPFSVLNPDGTRPSGAAVIVSAAGQGDLPSPIDTAARWSWLLGSLLLLGAPLFLTVVVRPFMTATTGEAVSPQAPALRMTLAAILLAAVAVTLGHSLQLALQALRLGGLYQVPELLLGTRAGTLILARQLIAATCAGIALRLLPPGSGEDGRNRPGSGRGYRQIGLLLCGIIAAAAAGMLAGNDALDEAVLSFFTLLIAGLGWAAALWPSAPGSQAAGGTKWVALRWVALRWAALLGLATAALLSISLGSHASAGAGSVWAVTVDFVHLMAAAAWVGGLLLVPPVLWRMRRTPQVDQDAHPRLLLVRRFSYLASFSVFLLIMTGTFSSLVELPNLPSLWQTPYGRVLAVKLSLLLLSLGLAFLNNRLVHGKAFLSKSPGTLPRLQRQVTLEAGMVLLLMLSVAVLVQTTTPRNIPLGEATSPPPEAPFYQVVRAGDLSINVQVLPNRVGYNRFSLNLFHDDGSPVGEVQQVELRFVYTETSLGQASVVLDPVSPTTFTAEGAYLSQPGEWALMVYIQRRGMDDILGSLGMDVPSPIPAPQTASGGQSPWENPVPGLPPIVLLIWGLAVVGIIPLAWREPLEAIWPGLYALLRRAAFLFIILGILSGLAWLVLAGTALG
jgi:copper transport protein